MKSTGHRPFLYLLCLAVLLLTGRVAPAQTPLVFSPHWLPQAQFAGYYMAQAKGFYKEAGLNVEITHPSASVQATQLLVSGKSDVISLFLMTGMKVAGSYPGVVHIAQMSQHASMVLVTKKSSGIDALEKLNGKRVAIWKSGFDETPKSLMIERNISVEWVPVLSSVNLFTTGGVEAMTVMWYNEYDQIVNCGIDEEEMNAFFLKDYGYDIPEDALFCLRDSLPAKREALAAFAKASVKGWEYAASHKEETLDTVISIMRQHHIPANRAHQSWMLDKVVALMDPETKQVDKGVIAPADFAKAGEVLVRSGHLTTPPEKERFLYPLIP